MQPFFEAYPIIDEQKDKKTIQYLMREHNKTEDESKAILNEARNCRIFKNDKYQVSVFEEPVNGFPDMIHLSIKRLDRKPQRDWREFQQIKNELVGEENEAVELYPAESRLVDGANQYHLWVIKDPKVKFSFGFHEGRVISDAATSALMGAVQRDRQ